MSNVKAKMLQIQLQRFARLLAGFRGATSKVREGREEKGGKGKGEEGNEGVGEEERLCSSKNCVEYVLRGGSFFHR